MDLKQLLPEFDFKYNFASDNNSGVLPEILEAFPIINQKHSHAYGGDKLTSYTNQLFKTHFGENSQVYFVFNGTAANVLSIQAATNSYNSVICSSDSHINMDECGAPEKIAGVKLIPLPTSNGKITASQIEEQLIRPGDQHYSQVKLVSITQPTELGTTYTIEEMRSISDLCKKHNLYFHVDGSRLVNAAAFLDVSLKSITSEVGVDILSLGGTKNGLLGAEAVVLLNDKLKKDFKFIRKQSLQLPSKMRFISVQFLIWLSDNLWLKNAQHSIQMAQYFEEQIKSHTNINITQKVESNALFPQLEKSWVKALKDESFFYIWDEKKVIARWMTTFNTDKKQIDSFIKSIKTF